MPQATPRRLPAPPDATQLLAGPALTPIALIRAMVMAFDARGMDPSAALAQAQITPAQLRNPAGRITATQMEVISGAAMRELDDEALGCFARPLPWGSYGLLARASLSSPTLGVALKRWCRHHGLLAPDATLAVEESGEVVSVALHLHRDPGPMAELCAVSLLRNIHGLASWYVDSRIALLGAQFPYAAPPHAEAYAVLFDGPTRFDAEHAAIHFDARYLSLPVRRDEAAMNQLLQRALPLTVRSYRRDRLLVQRVRQVLASRPQDAHNANDLAALLNTSPRTLHRQLRDEGASLQSLKDESRRQRATEMLLRTKRPIKQVAEAAGFQNEKSFIRAFKGWTGKSPGEWRGQ
ncbi:AraC family transcriptional regulator [Hydrogenophaga sp. Root209]|uniref:AraC family transcriptional regulator n=1 Tax=Hydrogenophaga sp. Root209 TaxID=1736490 RepID=UPI000700F7BA|nr:AraC family transcriptional regulator [Hydrogenophaga sp. Root209]KRC09951.1 AraC family transcriptional regulator [Hydrogenophaga sp. Root209]